MSTKWDIEIHPNTAFFDLKLKEVWKYRDLLFLFVRRDFVAQYKQTVLGPLWYFIQPLLTTMIFTIIFANIAKIPTGNVPHLAFYLSGLTFWQYFSDCLNATASTFNANQHIFGKVYFPRMIVPLSIVTSGLIKFSIQFTLFIGVTVFYAVEGIVSPNYFMVLTPVLVLILAMTALGVGMIFSSLTTKYRDLIFLLAFGIQLLMYATPVIYPVSVIPDNYRGMIFLNPITHIIETVRFAFLGSGSLNVQGLMYSAIFALIVFMSGLLIFNKVEKKFMDTV